MLTKNPQDWAYSRANNNEQNGNACMEYAEQWADLMEIKLAEGKTLENIADSTSHEVDQRPGFGITGFMYGAAVSALALCWVHGDQLRRWHNLKTQLGNEGEKANDTPGGVLNPALLNIGGE